MKARSTTRPNAVEEQRAGAKRRPAAQLKSVPATVMPDARAASLAHLRQQEQADHSTMAAQLRAHADLMSVGNADVPVRHAAEGVVQRAVALDLETVPTANSTVHIRRIDRPATPNVNDIPGTSGSDAARHILPSALLKREFEARYSGKSVAALAPFFPQVAFDKDYLLNLAQEMWNSFLYESIQLNEGGNHPTYPKPAGAVDISARHVLPNLDQYAGAHDDNTKLNRNYWAGDQGENLSKDAKATTLLSTANTHPKRLVALCTEFDPPPFVTKRSQLQQMGKEWARLTNAWLTNDLVARARYWPGRDVTWHDAFDHLPAHMAIWNKAK